jgi:hypothetical protein
MRTRDVEGSNRWAGATAQGRIRTTVNPCPPGDKTVSLPDFLAASFGVFKQQLVPSRPENLRNEIREVSMSGSKLAFWRPSAGEIGTRPGLHRARPELIQELGKSLEAAAAKGSERDLRQLVKNKTLSVNCSLAFESPEEKGPYRSGRSIASGYLESEIYVYPDKLQVRTGVLGADKARKVIQDIRLDSRDEFYVEERVGMRHRPSISGAY